MIRLTDDRSIVDFCEQSSYSSPDLIFPAFGVVRQVTPVLDSGSFEGYL
jgi:hypothetical protein